MRTVTERCGGSRQAWNEVEGSGTEGTEREGTAGLEREVGVVRLGQARFGVAGTV